ncbi:MAG: thiamine pyrophosphate-dependent dehydrogenase E1 component subunit alpha [Spirochaetes bacterium]|nr:thiamine pyrophosphate-dependent dehydrogenase E1 component subunit alpha [Spirochaetota bacterium]
MRMSIEDQKRLYRCLYLTRHTEEVLSDLYREKKSPYKPMTGIGQEAVTVGASFCLSEGDFVSPALRELGAMLTRGMSVRQHVLDALKKPESMSGGRFSAHHSGDISKGIILGTYIVGSNLPVALGVAFSLKYTESDRVVLAFFGDGASSTGSFHSAMNCSSTMNLPLVLVCNNNAYALSTPLRFQMKTPDIYIRAAGYGMEGVCVDGQDVCGVVEAVDKAVRKARAGGGPTLIECKTYRFRGHSESHDFDDGRPAEELSTWRAKDPLVIYRRFLLSGKKVDEKALRRIEREVEREVKEGMEYAFAAPELSADKVDMYTHLYADNGGREKNV